MPVHKKVGNLLKAPRNFKKMFQVGINIDRDIVECSKLVLWAITV